MIKLIGTASVLAMAMGSASPSLAQTVPSDQAAAQTPSDQLQDIVVTAQRRTERLQDVPLSVTALTGDLLLNKGAIDPSTLNQAVPGLVASKGSPATLVFLRGVGENAANPNDEASVATYVDGVYMAAPFGNVFSYNNIERIEVLKGPQGTLFGRNATGGVVQVITRDPGQTATIEGKIGYGNYNTITAALYGAIPITANLAADLAVQYDNQQDGFGRNITLNRDIRKGHSFDIRSKWIWSPSDATKLTLSFDYGDSWSNYTDFRMPEGVLGADGQPTATGQNTSTNVYPETSVKQGGVSGRLEQDINFARLVFISAYRRSAGKYIFDPDATATEIVNGDLPERQHNVSEELQILSNHGSKIDWVLGAFYYNNTAGYYGGHQTGSAFGGLPYFDITGVQTTQSISGYGQATIPVIWNTKFTAGLRYTSERQQFNAYTTTIYGTTVAPELKQGFDRLTWRLALDHSFTRDVHAYVSYNRGVKSGGFDLLSPGVPGYRPEVLDAYEVGLKSELFDHRVRANLSLFYYNYKDIQVQAITGITVQTQNAASAHIKGLDFDGQAKVSRNLTITGGFELLDGRYQDFPNAIFYPLSATQPSGQINAKGNRTVRSPVFSGNISADYVVPTSVGDFNLNVAANHTSTFYWSADNNFKQKPYTLLNASLGWTDPSKHYGLTFWVKNLTDQKYLALGVPSAFGALSAPAAPRTFGGTANFKF